MGMIFPVTAKELSTGDTYTFQDMSDLKIFVDEFKDILEEFVACTADGHPIRLSKDILEVDNLNSVIENKGDP